jgi:putative metalloprotease
MGKGRNPSEKRYYAALVSAISGCFVFSSAHAVDFGNLMGAGSKAIQAATLSDADIKSLSDKSCA